MIRILVDGEVYRWQTAGGISRIFTESMMRMRRFAPEIAFRMGVSTVTGEVYAPERFRDVPEITVPRNFRPRRLSARVNILRERWWKPDLFHSTYYTMPRERPRRVVATVYDFTHDDFPTLAGRDTALCSRKAMALNAADTIIAISECVRQETVRHIPGSERKLRVIHPGVADTFLGEKGHGPDPPQLPANIAKGRPYWLFVGDRSNYKNFGTLLRAFVAVAGKSDVDLVLAGGSAQLSERQVDFLISNRLSHRVHLLGIVSDEILGAVYRGAVAFVFPSCSEGFGIPLLEAMASRTAVIASDIPVFHEVAGKYASFFSASDHEELADCLRRSTRVSADESLLNDAQSYAKQFTWDVAAKKLADVYRE